MNSFKEKLPDVKCVYKVVNGINLPMNIYLPSSIEKAKGTIVAIHGGAWNTGVVDNCSWNGGRMAPTAKYYAQKGYISIAFSYRSVLLGDTTIYDIISDCEDAMRYIINNLEYVNINKTVVIGDSAGGHLATMLGISQCDDIRPHAVVACNPVLDCTREKWRYAYKSNFDYISASPYHQNPKKCARFLFMHGTQDTVVEIEDTIRFNEKLIAMGHSSQMITVDGAKHAFALFDYHNSDEYVLKILSEVDKFIDRVII